MKNPQIQKTTPENEQRQITPNYSSQSLKLHLGVSVALAVAILGSPLGAFAESVNSLSSSVSNVPRLEKAPRIAFVGAAAHSSPVVLPKEVGSRVRLRWSEQETSVTKLVVSSLTVSLEETSHTAAWHKVTLENQGQKTEKMAESSSNALKKEESKLKVVLAEGPMKVSDVTETKETHVALSGDEQNNTTSATIPVISPEAENSISPQAIGNNNQPTSDLEIPVVVSNQEKQAFSSPPIETIKPENTPEVYQVKKGDTLNKIASRYGVSVAQLMQLNGITNQDLVDVNQKLLIPNRESAQTELTVPVVVSNSSPEPSSKEVKQSYSVQVSNSYTSKLKSQVANLEQTTQVIPVEQPPQAEPERPKPNLVGTSSSFNETTYPGSISIPVDEPSDSPELNNFNGRPLENLPPFRSYQWPTKGVISSGFGRRWGRMHKGIDIASSLGTPVVAAASGEVISAGWNSGGYGNLVVIKHANRSVTFYAHNSRLLVRTGQIVQEGEQISAMGSTGHSTGPHLHFEIRPDGSTAANPIAFLPSQH